MPTPNGKSIHITLQDTVLATDQLEISYTAPADDADAIKDLVGNTAVGFTNYDVINDTADPELTGATIIHDTLTLEFDEPLDEESLPPKGQFVVTVNGAQREIASMKVEDTDVILVLVTPVTGGDVVKVSYSRTTSAPLQDVFGNDVATFTNEGVTNNTPETPPSDPPTMDQATITGDTLVLTFSETLDRVSTPPKDQFVVTVDGEKADMLSMTVRATEVTIVLVSAVEADNVVKVSYTRGSSTPLQDIYGNVVETFTNVLATNATDAPEPPPPVEPAENLPPVITAEIHEQYIEAYEYVTIDLNNHFEDPEEYRLRYAVESSNTHSAIVSLERNLLTIFGIGNGEASITVVARDVEREEVSQTFEAIVEGPEVVWLFPATDSYLSDEGFLRIINHGHRLGRVTILPVDETGYEYEPLMLRIGANEAVHLNSYDLEEGNNRKGLSGATGWGIGDWRLALEGRRADVEVLPYARTYNGVPSELRTIVHTENGAIHVPIFNSGRNRDQISYLRLVNPFDKRASITVSATDDAGKTSGSTVRLSIAARSACTVDSWELERGEALQCGRSQKGLGIGSGRWRLRIESDYPLIAMNLMADDHGHLSNLSGVTRPDRDGIWNVRMFPTGYDSYGRKGFVRIANRSRNGGHVTINAQDDTATDYESRIYVSGRQTTQFDTDDLEFGNRDVRLYDGIGTGQGVWRLKLHSRDLDFEATPYVHVGDEFLSLMHAFVPEEKRVHKVAFFNPASNTENQSILRLVYPVPDDREEALKAQVRITGTDDTGVRMGTTVRVNMMPGDAVNLTSEELETGNSPAIVSGKLGDGVGKWRLRVETRYTDILVMNLLENTSTGHLMNLSPAGDERGFERFSAPTYGPPEWATLEMEMYDGFRKVRGKWGEHTAEGDDIDYYWVEFYRNGMEDEDFTLQTRRNTMRWSGFLPGVYQIRVCTLNEDHECHEYAESNELVLD